MGLGAERGFPTRVLLLGFYPWLRFKGLSLARLEGRLRMVPVWPARLSTKPMVVVPGVTAPRVTISRVAVPMTPGWPSPW